LTQPRDSDSICPLATACSARGSRPRGADLQKPPRCATAGGFVTNQRRSFPAGLSQPADGCQRRTIAVSSIRAATCDVSKCRHFYQNGFKRLVQRLGLESRRSRFLIGWRAGPRISIFVYGMRIGKTPRIFLVDRGSASKPLNSEHPPCPALKGRPPILRVWGYGGAIRGLVLLGEHAHRIATFKMRTQKLC
jgi:hypothetical protein